MSVMQATFLLVVALCSVVIAQPTLNNCKNSKHLAVTIDDGPGNWVSYGGMLDALKAAGVVASFQVIGGQIKSNEALVKRYFTEGHFVANHLWSHTSPSGMGASAITKEANDTWNELRRIAQSVNKPMPKYQFMRPPNGANPGGGYGSSLTSVGVAGILMWSIDPQDYQSSCSTQGIISAINNAAGNTGHVLLQHGQYACDNTQSAFAQVLDAIKKKGFTTVTPDVCMGLSTETAWEGGSTTPVNACATSNGGCDATNGVCTLSGDAAKCSCKTGYTIGAGNVCKQDAPVNACATNNGGCDKTNGICKVNNGGAVCSCATGYTIGASNVCTANPQPQVNVCATNNGGCDKTNGACALSATGKAVCSCDDGFTLGASNVCTEDEQPQASTGTVPPAATNACQTSNGGCDRTNGVCTLKNKIAVCTCKPNFVLASNNRTCTAAVTPATCSAANCVWGKCTGGACVCHDGYQGDSCEDCADGYSMTETAECVVPGENQNLNQQPTTSSNQTLLIVIIAIAVVVVIAIGVVLYYCSVSNKATQYQMNKMSQSTGYPQTTGGYQPQTGGYQPRPPAPY